MDFNLKDWPKLYEAPFGETSKKYIFISYSHEDKDIVYQDLIILSNNGARIWYDKAMHVGQNWIERARSKINDKNCAAVIFYVSENSLSSTAFLKELDYAVQRCEKDENFIYMSVNIGEKTAFEILKRINVKEETFIKLLMAFNEKKIYIPRNSDPFRNEHIVKLIDIFEEVEAIDTSKCSINQTYLYEYMDYEQGLQIINYRGADSIVNIPANYNGKKVLAIGINTFKNNITIKKVSVPEGILVIDDFSFSGCINLEVVILPNSLKQIGYEAFRECDNLKEIVIPYNVERIGGYCFYKCHKLSNIVMLSIVPLSIEFAAFSECHAVENLRLPESTTTIEPYAFNNCISMVNMVIPSKVGKIGLSAFYNCASLNTVTFETGIFIKNNKLFARCRNLKSVIIKAGKKKDYLNDSSWDTYQSLLLFKLDSPTNVTIDTGILSWDSVEAADYYIITINDKRYKTTRPLFRIDNDGKNEGQKVTVTAHSNDECIIASEKSLELMIEAQVNTFEIIGEEDDIVLKKYNGNAPEIRIPEEVTIIDDEVFYNREELKEVIFPKKLRKVGKRAFYHCLGLQNIQLGDSLIDIGEEAFWGASVKELSIPQSVHFLGQSCFACCNNLTELVIHSPEFIAGEKVFYRCINLRKVIFPNGLTELHNGMFRGCTELDNLILPQGLHVIRSNSVSYIMGLKRINIPESVCIIEENAFSNSFGLAEIYVDENNRNFYDKQGVLFSKENNTLIQFPADKKITEYNVTNGITAICNFAFMDAEHLEKITIGKDVQTIGKSAFERCPNLKEVVITGEVKCIRENAFKDCINLDKIILLGGVVPEIETGIFDNVGSGFKIIVQEKYIKNYLRIIEWEEYRYLIQVLNDTTLYNRELFER